MPPITMDVIRARHSVRKYTDRPIEAEKTAVIQSLIDECNREGGLHIQLITDEPRAFSSGIFKYGQFSGVKNYLALVAPKGSESKESTGYYGQKIVLLMQALGLNTCWVALTFKNIREAYTLRQGEELKLVVACGYGETAGVQHPQKKPAADFYDDLRSDSSRPLPEWFSRGIEAALLAPTAVNQQKFHFQLTDGNKVGAKAKFDIFGNSLYDLGIVKCNFELAAGKDNFHWI